MTLSGFSHSSNNHYLVFIKKLNLPRNIQILIHIHDKYLQLRRGVSDLETCQRQSDNVICIILRFVFFLALLYKEEKELKVKTRGVGIMKPGKSSGLP